MRNQGYNQISLANVINGETTYTDFDYTETLIVFTTQNFNRYSSIPNSIDINFTNCRFLKGIIFKINSNVINTRSLKIQFNNCYLVDDNEYGRKSQVTSKNKNPKITLFFTNCIMSGISFKNFNLNSIIIHNTIFQNSGLALSNSQINVIQFQNCFGKIYLNDCIKSRINIFYQKANLSYESGVQSLIHELCRESKIDEIFDYKTVFEINGVAIVDFIFKYFEPNSSPQEIDTETGKSSEVYKLNNGTINNSNVSAHFNLSKNYTEIINIKKGIFDILSLEGKSNCKVTVNDLKCNKFILTEFNSSQCEIDGLTPRLVNSTIDISNSDLTNVWFKMCQFGSFDYVNIYRSTIERAVYTASTFPKHISSFHLYGNSMCAVSLVEDQFDIYRQLKLALSNQGNQIQALQMHDKMYATIRKSRNLSFQDQIILFINDLSNKHGTSISKPFFIFILLIIILFILYCLSLPNFPFRLGLNNTASLNQVLVEGGEFLYNNFKSIFILANPAHRIESLVILNNNIPLSGWSYFISFISRILIAWIFYQFITAFRKFGRTI